MPRVRFDPEREEQRAIVGPRGTHAPRYVVERSFALEGDDAELLERLALKWRITERAALRRVIFAASVAAGITGREVKPR